MTIATDAAVEPQAIVDARDRVAELFRAECTASDHRQQLDHELVKAQAAAAAAALEAAKTGSTAPARVIRTVGHVRDEQEAVDAAILAARREREAAILEVWRAQADHLRAQAKALRAEADERQRRTDELLDALEEHEGVRFRPPTADDVRATVSGPVGGYSGTILRIPTAKTQILRNRADLLDHEAVQHERRIRDRSFNRGGGINAANRDDLLLQLRAFPSDRFAPVITDVLAWYDAGAAREIKRRQSLPSNADMWINPAAPVPCQLTWRDGAIDPSSSKIGISVERPHAGRVEGSMGRVI